MSSRPRKEKQIRRLEKALRRTPDTYIDLVQWLKDRRYAQTSGEARKLLVEGRVMSGSHRVGRIEWKEGEFVAAPLVPSFHRKELVFLDAD